MKYTDYLKQDVSILSLPGHLYRQKFGFESEYDKPKIRNKMTKFAKNITFTILIEI